MVTALDEKAHLEEVITSLKSALKRSKEETEEVEEPE